MGGGARGGQGVTALSVAHDGVAESNCLTPLCVLEVAEETHDVGVAQPGVNLHFTTQLVNDAGILRGEGQALQFCNSKKTPWPSSTPPP